MGVKISKGNSKMGTIRSVSLPAGLVCRKDCTCLKKCYARKLERIRKTVRESYLHNYDLLTRAPDEYWRDVEGAVMMSRYFRFHVSGDIPDKSYLAHMIDIAERNRHCEILCFTKKYELVNETVRELVAERGKTLPPNLHLIFSGWRDLPMNNPYNFPEAHVRYRDGFTTAKDSAKKCGGNCTECAETSVGCWTLKRGEQVVFNEH